MRQRDLDGVDGADQVGVDAVGPGLHRWLAFHGGDTGLGHDDVDLAELGQAGVERLLELAGLADIGLRGDDAAARLLDEARGLFEILRCGQRIADGVEVLAQVDGDDVGALFGEPDRVAATLPRAAPVMNATFPATRPSVLALLPIRSPFGSKCSGRR